MKKQNMTISLLTILSVGFTVPALAHTGTGATHSFMAGFIHPWLGIDHMLVMFAIGLWGCLQGGKQIWLLPMTFLLWMTTGAAFGFANLSLPYPELWVTMSVVVCGLLIVNNHKIHPVWAMALVALFAITHGYIHAAEIPKNTNQIQYVFGFMLTTAALHSLGIIVGLIGTKKLKMIRVNFGLVCTSVGALLLVG